MARLYADEQFPIARQSDSGCAPIKVDVALWMILRSQILNDQI
jgi:hypothetical protein